ncbi:MAG: uncharacterized protein QOF48_1036 [Verrucomicrobiota bacterium]|jgi:hypothetical protein
MMNFKTSLWWLCGILLFIAGFEARGDLVISEILFNPPSGDSTNEFIELRGTPNMVLGAGTYLLAVEGDASGDPGTIQNLFDLSGRRMGQNGYLVLLQKFHRYKVNPLATVITNSDNDGGWGSGSSSSVRHHGENNQTQIESPSLTFFLIQSAVAPVIGDDIDANDNGVPDGTRYAGWSIYDAVGVLDADGLGDFAYGRINFRRDKPPGDSAKVPLGSTVVSLPFTPGYIGRIGDSAGWDKTNWVVSDKLLGSAPLWFLGSNSGTTTNTFPWARSRAALNHLGAPNFGAKPIPAVIIKESSGSTLVAESGARDSYTINLAYPPSGAVTTRVDATFPLQISSDGLHFASTLNLVLSTTAARRVVLRAPDDRLAGPSPLVAGITHSIIGTRDPNHYPTTTLILPVSVQILDNEPVLLSEIKVNPPGINDGPFEYIELKGPPGVTVTNLYALAVSGDAASAGRVDLAVNLTGHAFGSNGLLVVAAPGAPYLFGTGTTVVSSPGLAQAGGALNNGGLSVLLVGSTTPIIAGADFDQGDNGVLEGLPEGAAIMDAVGWKNSGSSSDVVYGGVNLTQDGFTPDAASRVPGDIHPLSRAAWMVGDLAGITGDSSLFDFHNVSTNLPPGSILTPGFTNRLAPRITQLSPLSHVIGDPGNPEVTFTASDGSTPAASLIVAATSTNPLVVPNENLRLTHVSGGTWRLSLTPVGVGYSDIIITAATAGYSGRAELHYAASEPGRPGAHWLTGISDASTAIPIDANWMLVGDDENQTLRLYSRTHSGPPVKKFPMNSFLNLRDLYGDGQPKEVDIEASTRVGNRLFWIGSHSHAGDTTERTNRARLFATDLGGSGTNVSLAFVGHYDFLKLDLLDWDARNLHGRGANYYGLADSGAIGVDPKAADGSGFNIEGLCMAPGSSTAAYVAFRAPLVPPGPRALALIVPVTNFTALAVRGGGLGSARFGAPIELNLDGRGIRSIEGSGTNYLIVAGPPGSGSNIVGFRLYTWNGKPASPPRERSADLGGMNPEGIVGVPAGVWRTNTLMQLVSDNGTTVFYGDDIQAKHLASREFKKFRLDTVELGAIVASSPTLAALRLSSEGAIRITWFSQPGTLYRVQCNTTLDATSWQDLPGTVAADGAMTSKSFIPDKQPQCFYRVLVAE